MLIMEITVKKNTHKISPSLSIKPGRYFFLFLTLFFIIGPQSCKSKKRPLEKLIVEVPRQMDDKVKELISTNLNFAISKKGWIDDSLLLWQLPALSVIYRQKTYSPFWSSTQKWLPQGDSLLSFIENVKLYGLFPEDYHAPQLKKIKSAFITDSLSGNERKDAVLWARADLLLSDALINIIHDLKLGRLPQDSITLRKDSLLSEEFVKEKFNAIASPLSFDSVISTLEPKHKGYRELKSGIKNFLENADFNEIPEINFPDSNKTNLKSAVIKRLFALGYVDSASLTPDSSALAKILIKFQKEKNLAADGKIGVQTIHELNSSGNEKFKRIAITLDRYKMLPDELPEKYIWVNIPSFNLRLISNDSVIISSRVVVGKPKTRSPVLTSAIYEMITYPQWTIPQSIIVKEILPALKKNPGYLAKKGFGLFDSKGNGIDPFSVDWTKYNKGVPYRIIQGSGDDNALGILKFNFRNKYAVYLHDTNQRFYFGLDSRALSHGCIRVQAWEPMAGYLIKMDAEYSEKNNKKYISADSVHSWLVNKKKHIISLNYKMPLFIRYFTCEGKNGRIVFFEDIYDEDLELARKMFREKRIG